MDKSDSDSEIFTAGSDNDNANKEVDVEMEERQQKEEDNSRTGLTEKEDSEYEPKILELLERCLMKWSGDPTLLFKEDTWIPLVEKNCFQTGTGNIVNYNATPKWGSVLKNVRDCFTWNTKALNISLRLFVKNNIPVYQINEFLKFKTEMAAANGIKITWNANIFGGTQTKLYHEGQQDVNINQFGIVSANGADDFAVSIGTSSALISEGMEQDAIDPMNCSPSSTQNLLPILSDEPPEANLWNVETVPTREVEMTTTSKNYCDQQYEIKQKLDQVNLEPEPEKSKHKNPRNDTIPKRKNKRPSTTPFPKREVEEGDQNEAALPRRGLIDKTNYSETGKQKSPIRSPPVGPLGAPPLTSEMNLELIPALRQRGNVKVIEKFGLAITVENICKFFNPRSWLQDRNIDFYLEMIRHRNNQKDSELPSVYIYHSFMYQFLISPDQGFEDVKGYTKNDDIFEYDFLFFPVHARNHWRMVVADLQKKRLSCYDSLLNDNDEEAKVIMGYLKAERKEKKKDDVHPEYDFEDWSIDQPKTIPQQRTNNDCGIFALQFADSLALDRQPPFNFTQKHIPYFRKRMAYETFKGELLPEH